MEFVSWDDDIPYIPNWMESHKTCSKAPTRKKICWLPLNRSNLMGLDGQYECGSMIPIHSNLSLGFPMYLDPPWRVNIEPWGFQNIQPEFSAHRGIPVRSSTSQAAKPFRCVRIGSPSTVPLDFFSRNEGFLINGDTPSSHPLMDFPLTIQLLGTPTTWETTKSWCFLGAKELQNLFKGHETTGGAYGQQWGEWTEKNAASTNQTMVLTWFNHLKMWF